MFHHSHRRPQRSGGRYETKTTIRYYCDWDVTQHSLYQYDCIEPHTSYDVKNAFTRSRRILRRGKLTFFAWFYFKSYRFVHVLCVYLPVVSICMAGWLRKSYNVFYDTSNGESHSFTCELSTMSKSSHVAQVVENILLETMDVISYVIFVWATESKNEQKWTEKHPKHENKHVNHLGWDIPVVSIDWGICTP